MANAISKKSRYIMRAIKNKKGELEEVVPFYVTQSIGIPFENSIITYETVGSDGGYSTNTGRITQEVPVTLQLIGDNIVGNTEVVGEGLQKNLAFIRVLRDEKRPVSIFGQIDKHKLFGTYLIKSVNTNIVDGTDSMIVDVVFREYKNINISRANIVIPSDKSSEAIISYLRQYNQVVQEE